MAVSVTHPTLSRDTSLGAQQELYLDNAATSWPKPLEVVDAVVRALGSTGNAGRSGHRLAIDAARVLFCAREAAAELFGMADPGRVLLTPGCTWSINMVLSSLPLGRHVVTTSMEHNAVARTLVSMRDQGRLCFSVAQGDPETGQVSPEALASLCTSETCLVVVNHGSNVNGVVQDIQAIKEALPSGLPILLDASQTAGSEEILVDAMGLDFVAVPGHKGLMGPPGTGLLLLGPRATIDIKPLVCGGTGSRSELDTMPPFIPDLMEAGTPNVPGFAGLEAGIRWLLAQDRAKLRARKEAFLGEVVSGLSAITGVRLLGHQAGLRYVGTVSFLLNDEMPGTTGLYLERQCSIMTRTGLHCAPWAHRTLGTLPAGTVRASWGPTTPPHAANALVQAMQQASVRRGTEGGAPAP